MLNLKQLLVLLAALLALASCKNSSQNTYTVTSLLPVIEQQVGKEIIIQGVVKHVCKHSGKKCFIAGDSEQTIRIDARGEIGSFTDNQIGTQVKVKGIVREQRVEESAIAEKEQALEAKKSEIQGDEEAEEHCASEQNSISKMRQWMQQNGKNYYAIYYVEGLNVVE